MTALSWWRGRCGRTCWRTSMPRCSRGLSRAGRWRSSARTSTPWSIGTAGPAGPGRTARRGGTGGRGSFMAPICAPATPPGAMPRPGPGGAPALWRYRHNDTVTHPRRLHKSWDGLVLRHDDPWWRSHWPPNGWGCRCRIETLADRDLERLGGTARIGRRTMAPMIGWIGAPRWSTGAFPGDRSGLGLCAGGDLAPAMG